MTQKFYNRVQTGHGRIPKRSARLSLSTPVPWRICASVKPKKKKKRYPFFPERLGENWALLIHASPNTANLTDPTVLSTDGKGSIACARETLSPSLPPFLLPLPSLSLHDMPACRQGTVLEAPVGRRHLPPLKYTTPVSAVPRRPSSSSVPYAVRPRRLHSGLFHDCGAANQCAPCVCRWRR